VPGKSPPFPRLRAHPQRPKKDKEVFSPPQKKLFSAKITVGRFLEPDVYG